MNETSGTTVASPTLPTNPLGPYPYLCATVAKLSALASCSDISPVSI